MFPQDWWRWKAKFCSARFEKPSGQVHSKPCKESDWPNRRTASLRLRCTADATSSFVCSRYRHRPGPVPFLQFGSPTWVWSSDLQSSAISFPGLLLQQVWTKVSKDRAAVSVRQSECWIQAQWTGKLRLCSSHGYWMKLHTLSYFVKKAARWDDQLLHFFKTGCDGLWLICKPLLKLWPQSPNFGCSTCQCQRQLLVKTTRRLNITHRFMEQL